MLQGKIPPKLVIQMDGGSENANKTFLAVCEWLCAKGVVNKVYDQIFNFYRNTLKPECRLLLQDYPLATPTKTLMGFLLYCGESLEY